MLRLRRRALWEGASRLPRLIFPAIYAIIGGSIIAIVTRSASLNIVNTYAGLELTLLIVLGLVIYLSHSMSSRINDLHKRSRLVVDHYMTPYEALMAGNRVIEAAQPGAWIRSVFTAVEAYSTPNDADIGLAQQRYFDSINDRLGMVNYHRLVQVTPADVGSKGRPLYQLSSPAHLEHYRKAIAVRNSSRHGAYTTRVDVVPARLALTFVIVQNPNVGPGGEVIFQINEHIVTDHDPPAVRMAGGFIIRDPEGQVVPHFDAWFKSLANSERLRAVSETDLSPSNAAGTQI
jgi:hypothetical protein